MLVILISVIASLHKNSRNSPCRSFVLFHKAQHWQNLDVCRLSSCCTQGFFSWNHVYFLPLSSLLLESRRWPLLFKNLNYWEIIWINIHSKQKIFIHLKLTFCWVILFFPKLYGSTFINIYSFMLLYFSIYANVIHWINFQKKIFAIA